MKAIFKTYLFVILVICAKSAFAAKDTIQQIEKVPRQLPDNFKENYQGKDYLYEKQDPTWLLKFKMWLAQKLISFFSYINYDQGFFHLKISFYILICGLALYIIARMLFYQEGRWIFKTGNRDGNITYQDDVETIEVSNFELMIQKALKEENYRLSVKFYYLWSLQKLAKKEIIELSNIKTNIDYQLELEGTNFYDQFHQVSYYYTYVWYGEFSIDKESFNKIASKYQQFLKEIAS